MPRLKGTVNNGSYLYIDYTIHTQNIAGNYTDISWTAGVHWGSYYFNIHNAIVRMATQNSAFGHASGTTTTGTYNSGWPIPGAGVNQDKDFKSGTTRVNHSDDGYGNLTFNGSANWDTPSNFTSTLSKLVGLPRIPQKPNAPLKPTLSAVTSTSVTVSWVPPANGGSTITGYQIGYGASSSTPALVVSDPASPRVITGLTPGTKYYFWVRAINSVGTGPYSPSVTNITLAGAHVLVGVNWKFAVPYVKVGGVWKTARPWNKVLGVWKETT